MVLTNVFSIAYDVEIKTYSSQKDPSMKLFASKPILWTLFIMGAISCSIISYLYFPRAFSIIHLSITMNRSQAVDDAKRIAAKNDLGPSDPQVATSFTTDEKVKTFVELEAGGKEAFVLMMQKNLYQPYIWQVRLFKPFEQREAIIAFTPNGTPYTFKEQLSENEIIENLSTNQALQKAETILQSSPWNNNLSNYTLAESSKDTTPSGRIDHTFVYERSNETIGDGRYRLTVKISGDHVSELNHTVKVPESFLQRYQEMRSKNENIAYLGSLLMLLLYGIGGCFFGLFYLIKKQLLEYKMGIYWGTAVAFTLALTTINKLPLKWMSYNTAYSPTNFLLQTGVSVLYTIIFSTIFFSLIFITAEGLTRAAFPNKIQFWRLFNFKVASSYSVLGYTVGGYLLIPFALAYTVCFYLFMTAYYNWWIPSSALFNPDSLATYFPWLEAFAPSLQAGFWEECLFRAVPLATAALLGKRYGKKNWWIASAFILQALIFGAAHANYPAQPAYARLIELTLFSFVFGGVYLRFGLLATIITHFGYDAFLFALPILVSTADGAFFNKIIISALSLTPLWIVLYARLKNGAWHHISEAFLNKAWRPAPGKHTEPKKSIAPQPFALNKKMHYTLLSIGLLSLIAWISTTRFTSDSHTITLTRQQAISKASQILKEKNSNPNDWRIIADPLVDYSLLEPLNKQHRFIWQSAQEWYPKLLGSYLVPPTWRVRFAKFSGSLNDRAEEHRFLFNPDGSPERYLHKLPETAPGKSLSRKEAKKIALQEIKKQYSLSPESLKKVSATAKKQPNRIDWNITYKDITNYTLAQGKAHVTVILAGDQVVDMYRSIHVPENWERNEDNFILLASIIKKICALAIIILLIIGSLYAMRHWGTIGISTSLVLIIGIVAIFMAELINSYPSVIFQFIPHQPFADQLFRSFGISAIMLGLRAIILAIIISFVTTVPQSYYLKKPSSFWLVGISIGAFFASSQSLLLGLLPSRTPLWADYTALSFLYPLAHTVNTSLIAYLNLTAFLLFALISIQYTPIRKNKIVGTLFFIFLGFIGSGIIFADNLTLFAASGLIMGTGFCFFYYALLQYNYAIIPIATGTLLILEQLQQAGFNNYPSALLAHGVAASIIAILSYVWYTKLIHQNV